MPTSAIPGRSHGLAIAIWLSVALLALDLFLMGMPGRFILLVGDSPFGDRWLPIHGDRWIEISIWVGLLWPPAIPLCYLAVRRLRSADSSLGSRLGRGLALALLLYAWAVVLASAFHSLASRSAST